MKIRTIYSVENDDPQELQPERALQAINLLQESFYKLATDQAQKAVSNIQGNNFTVDDVFFYNQTVNEIGMKTIESCAKMRSRMTEDQEQEPRNKHFIEGIQAAVSQAVKIANDFVKAFHLQRAVEDYKNCQDNYVLENHDRKLEGSS